MQKLRAQKQDCITLLESVVDEINKAEAAIKEAADEEGKFTSQVASGVSKLNAWFSSS